MSLQDKMFYTSKDVPFKEEILPFRYNRGTPLMGSIPHEEPVIDVDNDKTFTLSTTETHI